MFLVRESVLRTGQRTPTGARKPSRTGRSSDRVERRRARLTRRSGPGTGREATASTQPFDGQPAGGRGGAPSRRRTETPTLRTAAVRTALLRWHGLPGQRERRRWSRRSRVRPATEVPTPATGSASAGNEVGGLRQRGPVRRPTGSGRHRDRETDLAPRGQRSRVRPTDRASTPVTEVGQPAEGVGAAVTAGFARWSRSKAAGSGSPGRLAEKGHRPPRPLRGTTTGDVNRSRRRLTPEDRPVVDRSTFWVAPGGCAGASRPHRPGLFSLRAVQATCRLR